MTYHNYVLLTRSVRSARRPVGMLVALLLATVLFSGCTPGFATGNGKPKQSTSENRKEGQPGVFDKGTLPYLIQQRGKLIVGVNFNVSPYSSKNPLTGSPEGF